MRRPTSKEIWIGALIAAAIVLVLLFAWDYLWINLIRSGNVESP